MNEKRNGSDLAPLTRLPRRRLVTLAAGLAASFVSLRPGAAQEIVPQDPTTGVAPSDGAAPPIVPAASSITTPGAGTRYFASTGHNLADPFRSHWELAGGESVLGAPISEERYATGAGGVLQTFENLVLLFDPRQSPPLDVRGHPLGKAIWAELSPAEARQPVAGCLSASCQFFPETGHTLSEPFASFWNTHGGAPIFGPPVSEPYADPDTPGTWLQLFECAWLESRAGVVAARPIGRELAEREENAWDPAFAPAPPNGGHTFLVKASDGLRLRSAPSIESSMVALLPDNTEFIAAADATGEWSPGYAEGRAGWVSSGFLTERPPLPQLQIADWDPWVWQGATLEETNLRREPNTRASVVKTLQYGDPVTISEWLKGEEVFEAADLWARTTDGAYVYSRNIGRNAPVLPTAIPPDAPTWGKWIDVSLIQQLLTAYDGTTPLRTVEVTTGMAGWETPPGLYTIIHRVANETMTSGAIGAENHYRLDDVLFTQYFTDLGHALHFAWWRTKETIGRPGSHGCINLLLDDARFLWDWAEFGTPIYIHP